jgi:hypothetical protein
MVPSTESSKPFQFLHLTITGSMSDLPYVWNLILHYNVLQLAMLLSEVTLLQYPLSYFL